VRPAAAALVLGLVLSRFCPVEPRVLPGLDVLREDRGRPLLGKRLGLITNHTGRTLDGVPAAILLKDELGLDVVRLFSPEHGFEGGAAAGEAIESARDEATGLPIESLYGDARAPTREMLTGIDTLVFDIQDVGVRFFTYVSTMKLAMTAAASAGLEFVVLDRPNPNGGARVEGPVLEPGFASFVGIASIPVLHGMTLGELARFFRASDPELAGLRLAVIPARGLSRGMIWDETGLSWRPPSPNLRTVRSAQVYPAFGLLEGVEVSEGRGTEKTFEQWGAPWIDDRRLNEALNARGLPGVRFRPASFVPRSIAAAPKPRFLDRPCRGVAVEVLDPRDFEAVRTGLSAIAILRSQYRETFRWVRNGERYWIDLLLGSDRPRLGIESGAAVETILERERLDVERFLRDREPYLLY
jgi:uncharacterized protein YbbC (DUF1343 family)